MALLQRTRLISQERLDLPDYRNIEAFVCADFAALGKYVWSGQNFVLTGFEASGVGASTFNLQVAGSVAIIGSNQGTMFIGAPSLSALTTTNLTPSTTNFVEVYIDQDSGGSDSRAFWDQTALSGSGAEFSQIVDTFIFLKAALSINTSNFTGDADKVAVCEVDVNSSGVITEIRDSRNMFFRLGRASNLTYSHPWATRVEPLNTQFTGADKDISTLKEFFDALMSSFQEIKGTTYWYENAAVSLQSSFRNLGMSVLTGVNSSARFSWSGSELSITDNSLSPSSSDTIAFLRLFDSLADLELTRQDSGSTISLANGEVLYIEIPDPLANVTYDGVGLTSVNYQVASRGSVPLEDNIYWLAYREDTKLYLRGLGELEAGEERQINDETPESLSQFLGFNPETATYVPYSALPDSAIFSNIFDTSDTLVTAISTNTANINIIGTTLDTNAYTELMDVVSGAPANSNEITGPVSSGALITLPNDSRDSGSAEEYLVGNGTLKVFLNGVLLHLGRGYAEVGTAGTLSDQIQILQDLPVGDVLTFKIDSLGGFNIGGGGTGDVVGASNVGSGNGEVFKQKVSGNLELRKIKAGAGISVITSGDDIIIALTGGTPEAFFANYITGQTSTLIGTGGDYNLSTNKLGVYRNGVLMFNSTTAGGAIDRYQEATNNSILVETTPLSSEVFTFINLDSIPTYRNIITGVTGTVLTVATYTMGDKSLRVFRNGVLMNAAGYGSAVDQYSETTSTSITLNSAAVASDVFVVESGPSLVAREDITGVTGTTLNITTPYTVGNGRLLVYRNGILMVNSTTLLSATDRYQETSPTTVELETAAVASDVFTFIQV